IANPKHRELEIEPVQSSDLDKYLVTFEQLLEKYKGILFEKVGKAKNLLFGEFIRGMEPLEAARYFIAMLYLAMHDRVDLEQTEDDIRMLLRTE
ncbi:MAG: hypothetical protein ACE5JV_02035, partial [Nitrososphaerales archaeon]